jgi:hypothetical protein
MPNAPILPPIRRENTFPYCGRLIVLDDIEKTNLKDVFLLGNAFSIDFPAMPEQIELARSAEYKVIKNMVIPDGVHQYMGTHPLEIPFSFKLHSFDEEYCQNGALSLLEIAARLHALITPIGDSNVVVTVQNDGALNGEGNPQPGAVSPQREQNVERNAQQATASTTGGQQAALQETAFSSDSTAAIDPPVTVRLELMYTRSDGPGIVCTGYVKDVRAVLFGPWMRGPDRAYNLPSAGEFSFTFVHRPGHGNFFSKSRGTPAISQQAQAYADLIKRRLYNTRDLQTSATYRGLGTTKSGS